MYVKTCRTCMFPYESSRLDPFLRLHFPETKKVCYSFSLKELIDYNFDVNLEEVRCIVCKGKTNQVRQSTINEDFLN